MREGSNDVLMQKGSMGTVGESGVWADFKKWLSRRLASGMLVLVPLGVTLSDRGVAVLVWPPACFGLSSAMPSSDWRHSTGFRLCPRAGPDHFYVSLLAILLLLVLLYLVGGLGQHLIGRRLIAAWEAIWLKIPLARTIYAATKQVMEALSQPQGAAFKSVVVVDFPYPGLKAIGFLTGYVDDPAGRQIRQSPDPDDAEPDDGLSGTRPRRGDDRHRPCDRGRIQDDHLRRNRLAREPAQTRSESRHRKSRIERITCRHRA